jgi:uncharacterized protein (UPF0332 family)
MPNPFLEKSNQSIMSAKLLIKQHLYSSTVSRAYYSSLQYIFHVLIEKLGKTHTDIANAPRTGTHAQAQYLLELELVHKNKQDYKWFQKRFPEFKEERVKADYFDKMFDPSSSQDAINLAESINNTLNKNFK